jgi:hypothetical protein
LDKPKDPVRVRTGRLGALKVHSTGRTNTGPARQAFLKRFEDQVDPDRTLSSDVRQKRAQYALREHMTRLAMARRKGAA